MEKKGLVCLKKKKQKHFKQADTLGRQFNTMTPFSSELRTYRPVLQLN